MKYNIKTIDGSRHEFELEEEHYVSDRVFRPQTWIGVPIKGGWKYISINHIISFLEIKEGES